MLRIINGLSKPQRNLSEPEVNALPVGTIFLGEIGTYGEYTLGIKTFSGIVDLKNPSRTWTYSKSLPQINNYREVDIEVTIKEVK